MNNYLFYIDGKPEDMMFNFASNKEDIGTNHDCELKNNTKISVLSDVEDAYHPLLGELSVVLVEAANGHMMYLNADSIYTIH